MQCMRMKVCRQLARVVVRAKMSINQRQLNPCPWVNAMPKYPQHFVYCSLCFSCLLCGHSQAASWCISLLWLTAVLPDMHVVLKPSLLYIDRRLPKHATLGDCHWACHVKRVINIHLQQCAPLVNTLQTPLERMFAQGIAMHTYKLHVFTEYKYQLWKRLSSVVNCLPGSSGARAENKQSLWCTEGPERHGKRCR